METDDVTDSSPVLPVDKQVVDLKKMLNHHVADNMQGYYGHKISFPFIETVGVGKEAKTVEINNDDEMISFLRSEDALYVYLTQIRMNNCKFVSD